MGIDYPRSTAFQRASRGRSFGRKLQALVQCLQIYYSTTASQPEAWLFSYGEDTGHAHFFRPNLSGFDILLVSPLASLALSFNAGI